MLPVPRGLCGFAEGTGRSRAFHSTWQRYPSSEAGGRPSEGVFRLCTSCLKPSCRYEVPEELCAALPAVIEKCDVFAVLWGAGGSLDGASRPKVDTFLKEQLGGTGEAMPGVAETLGLPEAGMLLDYAVVTQPPAISSDHPPRHLSLRYARS